MPSLTTVWIYHDVCDRIVEDAERMFPDETGGILMGYWDGNGKAAVVTDYIGPGPQAVHELHRFVPDYRYQESEVARIYRGTSGWMTYLGDWHSHGSVDCYMSRRDKRTLVSIARDEESRAPRPLMMVVGCGPDSWKVCCWEAAPTWVRFWRQVEICRVRVFEGEPTSGPP